MTGTSPLREIETAVLAEAKDLALDVTGGGARAEIARLVDDHIRAWNDDFHRGRRTIELLDPDGLAERACRNLLGYGPLEPLLADPDVWEVMVNAPDQILVKRHRGPNGFHPEVFHDDDHVLRTLTKILDDSRTSHRKLDPSEGLQDAQLDDGSRLHIVHRDISRGGHTMVNIRRFTGIPFRSLDELVDNEMLTAPAARFLRACVAARRSIVFAGPPGAGKTTLMSCCTAALDPDLRVVIAEEVFEADVPLANVASMQTRAARPDRPGIDLRRLVSGFLRMAPDIAIVGEVRDHEALPLLLTLSSGVKGYTTIHSGSARQALTRLRFICQLAAAELSIGALDALVSEAVDLVVHSVRTRSGPRVDEIVAVEHLSTSADSSQFTVTDVFRREAPDSELAWTGAVPTRLGADLAGAGVDVRALLDTATRAVVGP